MGEGRTSNVIKNSVASLIFKVVSMLIQFAIRTVFIYCLGKEYTGISGLFTDILTVLSVMELGLDTSMVYSMYKPIAQKDTRKVAILMGVYRKMFTVIGILLMVSGVLCVPFLEYIVKGVPNIKEDIRLIFLAYVATSAVSYFLIYKTLIFRADQKSRVISNISMMVQIVECVAEIILIIIFKEFVAYLLVHFVATFLRNYILAKKAEKEYPEWFRKTDEKLDKAELRTLWRDMACIGVYNISGVVINSTDSIFISAFIGTVEVAIIGNFTMIIKSVRTTVEQIVGSAKASIGNLAATSTKEKQEAVFQQMNFLAFWVAAFCCTCLFVLLNPFIGDIWFDSTYETSMPIIAVLVINFFIAVMVYPVESFRTANGLFVQGWLRPAIMALLNIILDFFLGRRYGILGIFIATTISRVLTQVWFDPYLVYRMVFERGPWKYYGQYVGYALTTVACCVMAYFLANFIQIGNLYLAFIFKVLVCIVSSNGILFLIYRRKKEFTVIKMTVKRILRKLKLIRG